MNIYQRLVVGYHGCDQSVVKDVILDGQPLQPSDNEYDWLGKGVYFWEHGPQRAREWAEWKHARGEIKAPAVIGAYIHLGRCFDLGDTWATRQLRGFYDRLIIDLKAASAPIPVNRAARAKDFDLVLRNLDCAVINFGMKAYDTSTGGTPYFQTVRGVFVEGGPAYEGAQILMKNHVQIAVRDVSCILGYFVPTPGL
jgi:hypothetical protein